MSKKRILLIIVACFLILGSSFGVTYAYLIDRDNAYNEFTVGENEIEVDEKYDPPKKLEPDIAFTKAPYVTNTGNIPCYVRVRADFSNSVMADYCELHYLGSLEEYNVTTETGNVLNDTSKDLLKENTKISTKTYTSTNETWNNLWKLKDDGYYYYTQPLPPNEKTKPLFTTVKIIKSYLKSDGSTETVTVNEENMQNFDILIYAESCPCEKDEQGEYISLESAWKNYGVTVTINNS